MTAPAMHVAHGRGLPIPTWRTPIGTKRRESSAPPFLRRTPEELEAAERVVPTPPPVTYKKPTPPKPQGRVVSPEEARVMAEEYLAGASYKTLAREHAPMSKGRIKAIITPHLPKPGEAPVVVRPTMTGGRPAVDLDTAEVIRLYVDERVGIRQIGQRFKTDPAKVSRLLKASGVHVSRNGWRA